MKRIISLKGEVDSYKIKIGEKFSEELPMKLNYVAVSDIF
jgi:hypothetical protein